MTSPLSILEATDYSHAKTRAARSHPNGAGWGSALRWRFIGQFEVYSAPLSENSGRVFVIRVFTSRAHML